MSVSVSVCVCVGVRGGGRGAGGGGGGVYLNNNLRLSGTLPPRKDDTEYYRHCFGI